MTPTELVLTMPVEHKRDRKPAKGHGHRSGCDCKWCKPEYLQKAPGDILTRSDPTISVRVRPEEKEAFASLCERLGESPPRVIRAEIIRLIEEDRESQALDRMISEEARREKMFKVTRITVTTSTEGLGDLPADLYVETAIEMIQNAYPGVDVEVELREVFETSIELEIKETGPREGDWMEERLGFEWSEREDIGRILQEAFDAACSRA